MYRVATQIPFYEFLGRFETLANTPSEPVSDGVEGTWHHQFDLFSLFITKRSRIFPSRLSSAGNKHETGVQGFHNYRSGNDEKMPFFFCSFTEKAGSFC